MDSNERKPIVQGVTYDSLKGEFLFDVQDGCDTAKLSARQEIHHINAFGRCYYYSYEFFSDVDSSLRTQFIHKIKFEEEFAASSDFQLFMGNAVNTLDQEVCLPTFKAFVYPQSMSSINRRLMSNFARLSSPDIIELELVKTLPQHIEFDYDRFQVEILDDVLPNGCPRYSEAAKEQVLSTIRSIMDDIHRSDYFSIARDIKKSKYRNYVRNFYHFNDPAKEQLYRTISNSNVLLFDDIVTSGTTIYHLLNCLRCINDSNNIIVYSLIGNQKVADII
ncbi:MAG: hypothetical protein MJZ45_00055 [Bacteroidales bacterium]|nr:hypothetical protein [Bacteroidales bacterium]